MDESKQIGVEVIEPGKSTSPEDDTGEEALFSRIPLQSRDKRKAAYLSWRALGFTVRESCDLTPCSFSTLLRWRREDEEFAEFETKWLRELQQGTAKDLLRLDFMRNMRLALYRDFKVLFKAAYDLHSLSARELTYLKIIRRLYTPQELVVLEKAMEPDSGDRPSSVTNIAIINVDGKTVEGEAARRAAARDLLDKFTVNSETLKGLPSGNGDGDAKDS